MFLYRLRDNKGSVIIVALWVLFILGMLALAVGAYVRPQLSVAAKLKYRAKLLYVANAGLKRAIAEVLRDKVDSYDALNDSWSNSESVFKDVTVGDGSFSVVYRTSDYSSGIEDTQDIRYGLIDEGRKININKASYPVLVNFFEIVGRTNPQKAAEIADSIIDWRDIDEIPRPNGAESNYYLLLGTPYRSKNGDFQVLEELLLVKGMTPEIFDAAKERVTLYGNGAVNINTADFLVLRSIGISDALAFKIINFRSGADEKEATEDDRIFDNLSTVLAKLKNTVNLTDEEDAQLSNILAAGLISLGSDDFMGHSTAKVHGEDKPLTVTFVFGRNKTIKYWRAD